MKALVLLYCLDFSKKRYSSEFHREGYNNSHFSSGREGSGKAKSSIGDNLLADERKGDPQLYVEGKSKDLVFVAPASLHT